MAAKTAPQSLSRSSRSSSSSSSSTTLCLLTQQRPFSSWITTPPRLFPLLLELVVVLPECWIQQQQMDEVSTLAMVVLGPIG
jgi:hypothetical protein